MAHKLLEEYQIARLLDFPILIEVYFLSDAGGARRLFNIRCFAPLGLPYTTPIRSCIFESL